MNANYGLMPDHRNRARGREKKIEMGTRRNRRVPKLDRFATDSKRPERIAPKSRRTSAHKQGSVLVEA